MVNSVQQSNVILKAFLGALMQKMNTDESSGQKQQKTDEQKTEERVVLDYSHGQPIVAEDKKVEKRDSERDRDGQGRSHDRDKDYERRRDRDYSRERDRDYSREGDRGYSREGDRDYSRERSRYSRDRDYSPERDRDRRDYSNERERDYSRGRDQYDGSQRRYRGKNSGEQAYMKFLLILCDLLNYTII